MSASKSLKVTASLLGAVLVTALAAEILLRLSGLEPHQGLRGVFIDCEPEDHMKIPHPVMGFEPKPGRFRCRIEDSPGFDITHWPDTSRATSKTRPAGDADEKFRIYLFGGSFTWGHGLTDSATFAWKLQSMLPQASVRNFGIGASSTAQSYMRLRQLLDAGQKPDMVILNYASFHDMRNTFSRQWSNIWHSIIWQSKGRISHDRRERIVSELRFPYAVLRDDGSVGIDYLPAKNLPAPLVARDRLVSINLADMVLNRIDDARRNSAAVTLALIEAIGRLCRDYGIEFVLTGLTSDSRTTRVLEHFARREIITADISVDIRQQKYNLLPVDTHPNEAANKEYAGKIHALLTTNRLVP